MCEPNYSNGEAVKSNLSIVGGVNLTVPMYVEKKGELNIV